MSSHYGDAQSAIQRAESASSPADAAAQAAIAQAHATLGLLDELTKLRILKEDRGSTR